MKEQQQWTEILHDTADCLLLVFWRMMIDSLIT